jgi:dTDP-glucose 4,6-dehydratase
MKLLVTGGAGFIGSNFILYWMREHPEDQIVNLDLLTYAADPRNLASVAENPNYTFIQGDIADPETVAKAMHGADTVVHFAAESHVDRSINDPGSFIRTNIVGTFVLLEEARKVKVQRFHHVSTDEVFGALELGDPTKFNEETAYHPHSPYSAAKAGSDHLVRAYGTTFGVPVTVSNTSNNYGPHQFPEKLIPVMILKALRDEKLPIYGDGLNVRDWIHVEDHCRGIELVILKGKEGETYCLGGDAERPNIEIAKTVLRELGKSEDLIAFVQDRPGHDRRYAIDSSKAKRELGWERKYDFDEGMRATIAWFKERANQLELNEQGIHTKGIK